MLIPIVDFAFGTFGFFLLRTVSLIVCRRCSSSQNANLVSQLFYFSPVCSHKFRSRSVSLTRFEPSIVRHFSLDYPRARVRRSRNISDIIL